MVLSKLWQSFLRLRLNKIDSSKCALKKLDKETPPKKNTLIFEGSSDEDSEKEVKEKKFCRYHGTCEYTTDEYATMEALIKQAKQKRNKH